MSTKVTVQEIKNNTGMATGLSVRWNDLTNDDDGAWLEMIGSKCVVQVVCNSENSEAPSGKCSIEGRNADDVEGIVLNSVRDTRMSFNNNAIEQLNGIPRYIRAKANNVKNCKFSVIMMITL